MSVYASDFIDLENPEAFLPILTKLRNNGATKHDIVDFLDKNMSAYLVDDIVAIRPEDWEAIGVDPKNYISRWLDQFGELYFSDYTLSDLPDAVTVRNFVDFYTVEEILDYTKSIKKFIIQYKEAGGRINHLAKKFIEELGYEPASFDMMVLLELVANGATCIDLDRLLSSSTVHLMDDETKDYCYDLLSGHGFAEDRIARLKM